MNEQLAHEATHVIPAYLKLVQNGTLGAADAARHLYCYTANAPAVRSLVPPGSAVDIELQAIEQRNSQLGFDPARTEEIKISKAINGGEARSVSISSYGWLTARIGNEAAPGPVSFPAGLTHFGVAYRLVEEIINARLMGEHVDHHPEGNIVDIFVELRIGGSDVRITRWVYGLQSASPPSPILQIAGHAADLLGLAERCPHA